MRGRKAWQPGIAGGDREMLVKILGVLLLVVGLVLALKYVFSLLVTVISVLFIGALIYGGWRLLNRGND